MDASTEDPNWWEWSAAALERVADEGVNGGVGRTPLPDLFIGAHAMVLDCRVLTRDTRRFKTYFPRIELITPIPVTLS